MRLLICVVLLAGLACGDDDEDEPSATASAGAASEGEGEGGAVRLGQCGYVKPGAVRGGTQGMAIDTADFGAGVPIELDTLQVQPVVGSWACLLGVVEGEDPPAPRGPADLGRFVLLREERSTVDASEVEPMERWLWVTDPAWVTEVERLRGEVRDATGHPGTLERVCESVGRARPDPEGVRSEAVTAMRHFVATGQVREEIALASDDLMAHVREIHEMCGW